MTASWLLIGADEEKSELEPVGEAELAEDRGQMRLDRALADHQPRGDVPIARTAPDHPGDLSLARRQEVEPPVGPDRASGRRSG